MDQIVKNLILNSQYIPASYLTFYISSQKFLFWDISSQKEILEIKIACQPKYI